MPSEILELAVDKFLFRFPDDLLYSDAGLWVRLEGTRARIGLTDFTQQRNGDVAFAEPKEPGTQVKRETRWPSSRRSKSTSASRRPWAVGLWRRTAIF